MTVYYGKTASSSQKQFLTTNTTLTRVRMKNGGLVATKIDTIASCCVRNLPPVASLRN